MCNGACGFVAEVRQAHRKEVRPTELERVMREHIRSNPLATAPYEIGVNGVRQGQWVVTLYAPHTCVAAVAAPAAAPAIPAAVAGACTAAAPAILAAVPPPLPFLPLSPPLVRVCAMSWHPQRRKR